MKRRYIGCGWCGYTWLGEQILTCPRCGLDTCGYIPVNSLSHKRIELHRAIQELKQAISENPLINWIPKLMNQTILLVSRIQSKFTSK